MMNDDKTERRAAEMLPGRVVNLLIHHRLQETKSWPHVDGRKTYHEAIPVVLANFIRCIAADLGVVADLALDKRISHKFTDLAWKKGKRDMAKLKTVKKRKHNEPAELANKKKRAAKEPSGNGDEDCYGNDDPFGDDPSGNDDPYGNDDPSGNRNSNDSSSDADSTVSSIFMFIYLVLTFW